MRKVWYLYKNHLATLFEYRSDMAVSILFQFIALVGVIIYWSAVYDSNTSVAGLGLSDILSYYLLLPLIYLFTYVDISELIGREIKDGILSNYLVKPFKSQSYYITKLLAKKSVNILLIAPFYCLPFIFLSSINLFTPTLLGILSCLIIILFTLILYTSIDFFIGYSAFWVEDVWAFRHVKEIIIGTLGGFYFPLILIQNPTLSRIVDILPFKYIFYVPMNYLLGKFTINELPNDIVSIIIWSLIFIVLSFLLWKKGLSRYEAYGK